MYAIIFVLAITSICQIKAGLSPELLSECLTNPFKNVNAMVELPAIAIDPSMFINGLPGETGIENTLIDILKRQSALAQLPIVTAIKAIHPDVNLHGFWVANRIAIKNVPCSTVTTVSLIPGVLQVRKEAKISLSYTGTVSVASDSVEVREETPQWGLAKINVPSIWGDASNPTKGAGVVVANIDTGVRGTHKALEGNWRGGDYSWFDGVANSSTGIPDDGHGHGTHVMGIMAGQNGIGVAPESTWIACRGCDSRGGCAETPILLCGQWIMCPYKIDSNGVKTEDCSKRPKIVNNSWSVPLGGSYFNEVIENWKKVGIVPFFSAANAGPGCFTMGSPANQDVVMSSVGATTENDNICKFSSRGPSPSGSKIKPDISAPGEQIFSSWSATDTAYATLNGTSMATPHASGAAALLVAKNPSLTYEQVVAALQNTAVHPPSGNACDICSCVYSPAPFFCCFSSTKPKFPNNQFGYGRIDAAAAYKSI